MTDYVRQNLLIACTSLWVIIAIDAVKTRKDNRR